MKGRFGINWGLKRKLRDLGKVKKNVYGEIGNKGEGRGLIEH